MKKFFILLLIVVSFFLTSCAGLSDWSFELPNDYEVWHINSKEIKILYVEGNGNSGKEVIPSFVKEFAYDNRYVYTRNIVNITENNILAEQYYFLDTISQIVEGPYDSLDDLKNCATEKGVEIPNRWHRTSQPPGENGDG